MNDKHDPGRKKTGEQARHFEDAKRNPFKKRMTGAGRAKKHRTGKQESMQKISQALGSPNAKEPDLLRIAAARLQGVGKGNPLLDFEFAAATYLSELNWESGNTIPVERFWQQLLELVEAQDPDLAQTFAKEFKLQFLWCVVGHVQRLQIEYAQRPESIVTVEIWNKGGKRTFVGVRRDGKKELFPADGAYPRSDPWICFAGTRARPRLSAADFERLKQMDPKQAVELLESGKLNISYPPEVLLFTADTVFNVAMPSNLERLSSSFRTFGFKPTGKQRSS